MRARAATATLKHPAERTPRKVDPRSQRLRTFDPEIVPLVRADLVKAHGKPEPAEPSVMEFIEQFFDEIHRLRAARVPWDAIHERISKYMDCSARTLQAYYNLLAQKRGLAPEPTRPGPRTHLAKRKTA
jgi:hypothetical protein